MTQNSNNVTDAPIVLDGYHFGGKSVGAVETKFSGRNLFLTLATFEQLVKMFPKVDPEKPHERNRKLDKRRAIAAGLYWLDNPNTWVFPPLIVTLDEGLEYTTLFQLPELSLNLELVKLTLPRDFASIAFLADGQHRSYGICHVYDICEQRLIEARKALREARELGITGHALTNLERKLHTANQVMARFETETIGVQIITNANRQLQTLWFSTMSDMQKPIGRGESFRMDEKTAITIGTKQVISIHPLLEGEIEAGVPRIDERKDNATRGSSTIFSLANVRDWVATLVLGSKTESSIEKLDDRISVFQVQEVAGVFFDALVEMVPYFQQIRDRVLMGSDFRKLNAYSSPTIARALALAANSELLGSPDFEGEADVDLTIDPDGLKRFKKFLTLLTEFLEYEDDPTEGRENKKRMVRSEWYATQLFREGATAPQSGFQDRVRLGAMFTDWSREGKIDFAKFTVTSEKV